MTLVTIQVAVRPPYPVHVGPGVLVALAPALGRFRGAALLTDRNVEALHAERLAPLAGLPRLALEPGEAAKSFATLERVLEFMVAAGLERGSVLATFGGGVVCDLGGLAAALYMRGIAVVHAPTTLLAQVDASVGGKTAVNLRAGKNLAGAFHQPREVACDTDLFGTLGRNELRSGLGEVVKTALLGAPGLFELLEREAGALLAREADVHARVVAACVQHKAGVVAADEREAGVRRSLNLGHTFAHAIEHAAGYGRVPHGVAVAVGLVQALHASEALGLLEDEALCGRVEALLGALELPASLADLRREFGVELEPAALVRAMAVDKKARRAEPSLVLPVGVGRLELDVAPGNEFLLRRLEADAARA